MEFVYLLLRFIVRFIWM